MPVVPAVPKVSIDLSMPKEEKELTAAAADVHAKLQAAISANDHVSIAAHVDELTTKFGDALSEDVSKTVQIGARLVEQVDNNHKS